MCLASTAWLWRKHGTHNLPAAVQVTSCPATILSWPFLGDRILFQSTLSLRKGIHQPQVSAQLAWSEIRPRKAYLLLVGFGRTFDSIPAWKLESRATEQFQERLPLSERDSPLCTSSFHATITQVDVSACNSRTWEHHASVSQCGQWKDGRIEGKGTQALVVWVESTNPRLLWLAHLWSHQRPKSHFGSCCFSWVFCYLLLKAP